MDSETKGSPAATTRGPPTARFFPHSQRRRTQRPAHRFHWDTGAGRVDVQTGYWGCPVRERWDLAAYQPLSPGWPQPLAFPLTGATAYEGAAALRRPPGHQTDAPPAGNSCLKSTQWRSELEARRAAPPGFTSLNTMTANLQNLTHTTLTGKGGAVGRARRGSGTWRTTAGPAPWKCWIFIPPASLWGSRVRPWWANVRPRARGGKTRRHQLRHARHAAALKTRAGIKAGRGPAGAILRRQQNHWAGHAARMNYRAVADRGWAIGSGAVESACCTGQVGSNAAVQPGPRRACVTGAP